MAVAALTAVLAGPSAALAACTGGPSAVNVYRECLPTGGGGKPTGGLSHAGKEKRVLTDLVRGDGTRRHLQASSARPATSPSAVGSAFDLDSAPTALLLVLAGTSLLILGGSGLRLWRHRHRPEIRRLA